jgi:hypothetical protein
MILKKKLKQVYKENLYWLSNAKLRTMFDQSQENLETVNGPPRHDELVKNGKNRVLLSL